MANALAWFKTELGRRTLAVACAVLYLAVTGDKLPADVAIPWLNVSFNDLLVAAGIGTAAFSGSNTRS